ncbi:hypothetical protein M422DRAFT_54366 [Sphaerobolus stellatus SS14]|uniref:DUF6699 domain-containing protein n=1 Tax=Sphaerobolus stellatus (strain SS14) TaxID=990650 RepID=A0A0C9THU0_SPHS4|nr:hypothetical protein M422DRAFT_54366 [Sphaerobolus stellatus SS14]
MTSLGKKATHPAMTLMGIAICSSESLSVIAVRNTDGVTVMDVFSALSKVFQSPTRVSITDEKSLSLSASQLEALKQAALNLLGAAKGDESNEGGLDECRLFAGLTEYAKIPNIWILNTFPKQTSATFMPPSLFSPTSAIPGWVPPSFPAISGQSSSISRAISRWPSPFSLKLEKKAKPAGHSAKRRHAENEEEEEEEEEEVNSASPSAKRRRGEEETNPAGPSAAVQKVAVLDADADADTDSELFSHTSAGSAGSYNPHRSYSTDTSLDPSRFHYPFDLPKENDS